MSDDNDGFNLGGGAEGDANVTGELGEYAEGTDDNQLGDDHIVQDQEYDPNEATRAIAALTEDEDVTNTIPPFANATNKELHAQILAKQRALQLATADAADHAERLTIMKEHLHNVRQELQHAQELTEARQKELSTEEHLKALTERAVGRMRQEIAQLDKRADVVSSDMSNVQSMIFRGSEKLEAFRAAMHMAQGELEKWAQKARAKEEDNIAIEKYTRGDEMKIRDMVREQERLTVAVAEKKRLLEKEVTETKAKQVELDKMAEDFRNMHTERQHLIKQWQDTLALIQRRDMDIATAAEHFARAKAAVAARRAKINEQEAILDRLLNDNKEGEQTIEAKTRAVGAMRDEMKVLEERVERFRDDVELLKTNVSAASSEVSKRRNAIAAAEESLKTKHKQVEAARKMLDDIRAQLAHTTAQVASTESAVSERESYMEREQARVEAAERRLTLLKEQLFKANEAVKTLRDEEAGLQAEIQGTKRTSRNLADRIRELDAQSLAQQEHVYAAEFQIQQMERKIARAKGEVSEEERVVLEARIGELKAELDEAVLLEKGLQSQCKQCKEDLKQALRAQTNLTDKLTEVQQRIDEFILQNKSAEDSLRKVVKEKEESMVNHDVLKLEIRKLRDALSAKTDEVYGLENRGAQLAMSMDARKREIEHERAVLRAELKLAEEERHRLAMDLTDRQAKISVLKAKYEALCARMRGSDETGEPRSQAYFILKAAQKREELQREGDELDAVIKVAERELKALSATLTHLNARNTALRDAFHRVDLQSDEASSVRALDQQHRDVADAVFSKKKQLQNIAIQIEQSHEKIAVLDEQIATLAAQIESLQGSQAKAETDAATQQQAVNATAQRVEAARVRHRERRASAPAGRSRPSSARSVSAGDVNTPTPDEVNFVAAGIKECNASVLFTIGQLAKEFTQLQPTLASLLSMYGLKMPNRPPAKAVTTTSTTTTTGASSTKPPTQVSLAPPPAASATSRPPSGSDALRRPSSGSSLKGAGRNIIAGNPTAGNIVAPLSPMSVSQGSITSFKSLGRPDSVVSHKSGRSLRSGSEKGLDLGLSGVKVGAASSTTPTSSASARR